MSLARSSLAVLLAAAVLASGCTEGDPAEAKRSPGDTIADALAAVQDEKGARYSLDVRLNVKTQGETRERELQQLANAPVSLHFEGGASSTALTADGSARLRGLTFDAELLVGTQELFLNFMNRWYRSGKLGLDRPKRSRLAQKIRTEEDVRRHFAEMFKGTVSEGPTVDDTETTQFRGTLDPQGIERLNREQGEDTFSPRELARLREIADDVEILLVTGSDDDLPRRLRLSVELTELDLAALRETTTDDSLAGIRSITADFDLKLSDWGEPVSYERPAQFEPLERIFGALGSR